MQIEFSSNILADPDLFHSIKKVVGRSHRSKFLHPSIDGLSTATTVQLCGLFVEGELASFSWIMPRTWILGDSEFTGVSIGLVTTFPHFRNKGLASLLLNHIEEYSCNSGMSFLYLQGIPEFYSRLGFSGFAPKCKFIFEKQLLNGNPGNLRPATLADIDLVSELYRNYQASCGGFICRDKQQWADLLGALNSTFLFYQPMLICDAIDTPIAYFCSSPDNPAIIREFVPAMNGHGINDALVTIASLPQFHDRTEIEIFSPFKGPILDYAASTSGADFAAYLRPRASNMIKWLVATPKNELTDYAFIFQGDNL